MAVVVVCSVVVDVETTEIISQRYREYFFYYYQTLKQSLHIIIIINNINIYIYICPLVMYGFGRKTTTQTLLLTIDLMNLVM